MSRSPEPPTCTESSPLLMLSRSRSTQSSPAGPEQQQQQQVNARPPPPTTTTNNSNNNNSMTIMMNNTTSDERAKALNNMVRSPVSSSRHGSRAPSPTPSDEDLPTHVATVEQLKTLPPECLSGDPVRPLQHFDENGMVYKYALNPMTYSVLFVLIVEGECAVQDR